MLAFVDNRKVKQRAARREDRDGRSKRIREGYKLAMKKYPKIIANLAE